MPAKRNEKLFKKLRKEHFMKTKNFAVGLVFLFLGFAALFWGGAGVCRGVKKKQGGPDDPFKAEKVCNSGETKSCYDGPAGTQDVGLCHAGIHTCKADGSGFDVCQNEVTPVPEDCRTAQDEDCDGK